MLVGNKTDLKNDRIITTEAGMECAEKFGVSFMETSAFSGDNINKVFENLGSSILKDFDEGLTGDKLNNKNKKGKCCRS